jgi:hypothetical protein
MEKLSVRLDLELAAQEVPRLLSAACDANGCPIFHWVKITFHLMEIWYDTACAYLDYGLLLLFRLSILPLTSRLIRPTKS